MIRNPSVPHGPGRKRRHYRPSAVCLKGVRFFNDEGGSCFISKPRIGQGHVGIGPDLLKLPLHSVRLAVLSLLAETAG